MLICLFTKDEVTSYVDACGLDRNDYAVLCDDKDFSGLGLGAFNANKARVLFTTQEMMFRRTRGKSFADATEFHFWHMPRSLRIWDESLDPARPVCVRLDHLRGLAASLRPRYPHFIDQLEAFLRKRGDVQPGMLIDIPQPFSDQSGSILSKEHDLSSHVKTTLEALWHIGGRKAKVTQEGRYGLAFTGCSESC